MSDQDERLRWFKDGRDQGVKEERARVVADLRAMAKGLRGITLFERNRLDKAADRYERGEHQGGSDEH